MASKTPEVILYLSSQDDYIKFFELTETKEVAHFLHCKRCGATVTQTNRVDAVGIHDMFHTMFELVPDGEGD